MILAFRHWMPEAHDSEPKWATPLAVRNEDELGTLLDGVYAVYLPSKTVINEREAANDLPKTFTFDRVVTISTPTPKPKVTAG